MFEICRKQRYNYNKVNYKKTNSTARLVKLADLKHNSDLTRLNEISEEDIKRYNKYQEAIKLLEN